MVASKVILLRIDNPSHLEWNKELEGGGGDDPGDPDEPDDSGLGDGQDEEDEDETATETEGEVPQEELPQSLHG